jgi:lactococcin 972 family bacteriocin
MASLRNALIVGCLAVSSTGLLGVSSALAESSQGVVPASSDGVTRSADRYNAAGEVTGGSVTIESGVVTRNEVGSASFTPQADVGGGTWDYGTSFNQGWSNYLHDTRNHGATVKQGDRSVSADTGPHNWASTTINRSLWGPEVEAFWRVND